jgi:hypothetical protein
MRDSLGKIWHYLIDRETWKRVYYFSRIKDPSEANTPLTRKDIVPIILAFSAILLFVYVVVLVVDILGKLFHFGK